jgi:nicotinamide mononucleotide transporter
MSSSSFFENFVHAAAATSVTEWIAIGTALVYVVLAAKENVWCWIFGIVSAGIYIYLNFSIQLYLDAWLSLYYVLVGIYGWYAWAKGKTDKAAGSILHRIRIKELGISLLAAIAGTIVLGKLSDVYTDSPVPYFDAALTSFSLVATYLTTQKALENWIFWIVIDAAYVLIYVMRGLPSTAALNLIYTFIAVYGFMKWSKNLKSFTA